MQNEGLMRLWFHLGVGCLLMVFSGLAYRLTAKQLDLLAQSPVLRKVLFSGFPYEAGPWMGEELPLDETVLKVANNEDYISRRYWNAERDMEVTFYIAYTSKPINMDGHRPTVCYAGNGWLHEETKEVEVDPVYGDGVAALLHTFRRPMSSFPKVYVLNYYIVSGQVTTDHRAFGGLRYRRVIQSSNNPRYVAQVQISSTSSTAALEFARQVAPMVWSYLPDLNSREADAEVAEE